MLSLMTLEAALVVRNAATGLSVIIPLASVALTFPLALITFIAGVNNKNLRSGLPRMALPAGVMAVGYGVWYLAARLQMGSAARTVPHWVQVGLGNGPSAVLCAGFALMLSALSLVIGRRP